MKAKYQFSLAIIIGLMTSLSQAGNNAEQDPAEIAIGERLFLETRFAQAWYAQPGKADPALAYTITTRNSLPSPFAGQTMNCRACHLVDEHAKPVSAGMRSYADFARHSPIPNRNDGQSVTGRNSMSLVNISIPQNKHSVFHFDGEFNTMEDLVQATLTGRNYGWLASEKTTAIKHIVRIIREDDGQAELAKEFGGRYSKILTGTARDIPTEFRLPPAYRVNVAKADEQQIMNAVAKLIAIYVTDLSFAKDKNGHYTGSPYDQFLKKNHLPRKPAKGESTANYNQRLLKAVRQLKSPRFINKKDGSFATHQQAYVFGQTELQGMKIFFAKGSTTKRGGNCIACHTAPDFSDFSFHNTGLSQHNYDAIHGQGQFQQLRIPNLSTRNQHYDRYLPATVQHPKASSRFRSPQNKDQPGRTDLGLWNVFANPDMPAPQAKLTKIICQQAGLKSCRDEILLSLTLAAFKTPVLRDLGHSAPYMHSGQFNQLKDAIGFYINSSALAKSGQLRNAAPALKHINIDARGIKFLSAFVESLNEDYD